MSALPQNYPPPSLPLSCSPFMSASAVSGNTVTNIGTGNISHDHTTTSNQLDFSRNVQSSVGQVDGMNSMPIRMVRKSSQHRFSPTAVTANSSSLSDRALCGIQSLLLDVLINRSAASMIRTLGCRLIET